MSEKLHYQLVGEPELLEVVDDDWLTATLPDDDVPLPDNLPPPNDDHEEARLSSAPHGRSPDRWTELALTSAF